MSDGAPTRILMEAMSLGTIAGAVFDWLPKIAVLLAIVWYVIQIRESQTWRALALLKSKPEISTTTSTTTTNATQEQPAMTSTTNSITRTSADPSGD